jgi:hypothetical protein
VNRSSSEPVPQMPFWCARPNKRMKLTWRETYRAFIDLAAPGSISLIRQLATLHAT